MKAPPTSFPAAAPARVVGPDLHLAHYPAAWGAGQVPPGAPTPALPGGVPAKLGHDQPSLDPFSNLPGSAGNVTWNVTLPVDRGPTRAQSDLYEAVWFGLVVSDPDGYDGECLFELQLYPDTNSNFEPQSGVWVGIGVGWQMDLATGAEDACYAAPLDSGHSSVPLQMNQGDTLTITLSGWIGSPSGENVSVADDNTGGAGSLTLYNTTGHYPLDPAYLANNLDDALPWSAGGNLPVSFAFDVGTTASGPQNNSYGGCSAGVPPPTPSDPSTPCGSYDPQSWANDTVQPWRIGPVTFFNKASTQIAVQLGVDQNLGGMSWINPLSMGACQGRDGSADCSYPWYSYDRTANAIEFGATDYYGLTYDFGQYRQYDSTLTTNTAALGYYAPRNFTVPTTITGDALSITITGTGTNTVHFLNYTLTASTTIDNLPSGSYSISSKAGAGEYFDGYSASGSATLDAANTPWSSFHLAGTGTVTATFLPTAPPSVGLHVNIPSGHGSVAISPGFNLATVATYPGLLVSQSATVASTTESNGGNDMVAPGMYSILALPAAGYNFTGWSITGNAYLFAPYSDYTWLNVSSTGGAPALTANFVATTTSTTVWLESVPAAGGTITFNGVTYDSGSSVRVTDGTYTAVANLNASYTFETWSYGYSASMTDFAASTSVVVQGGTAHIYALFHSSPSLTIDVTGAGAVAFNGALHSGAVALSQVEATSYPIVAAAQTGSTFAGWHVSSSAELSVADPSAPVTVLTVNGTGTLTATFTTAFEVSVTFHIAGTGAAVWNFNTVYSSTTTNASVGIGTYDIAPSAGALSMFNGWNTSGGVSIETLSILNALGEWTTEYELSVSGDGTVYATFVGQTFPVTFVDMPSTTGTIATFTGTGSPIPVHAGTTASLAPGVYSVALTGGSIATVHWVGTSNLTLSGASGLTTSVTVAGSATLYALAVSLPIVSNVVVTPTIVEPGVPFTVTATVAGGTAPYTFNFSLPASLAGDFTCTPAKFKSVTSTNSTDCTVSLMVPGDYTEPVYANVTDLLGYGSSASGSVQLLWPPALTFTSPTSSSQISSVTNLSLAVNWTNDVPSAALPGLVETVGLIDQATNAYVTDTPTTTQSGLPSLWINASATNSLTLGPSDLLQGSQLEPGSYWIAISVWSSTVRGTDGSPSLCLTTVEEPLTVADVQLLSPAPGSSATAGNVTLAYALAGPGITQATLVVLNQSGPVSTTSLPLQPASGTGSLVLDLGAGTYTATLSTYNAAANMWLNSSSSFTVGVASVPPAPPPVYHNTTGAPAYLTYVYAGLLVLGAVIGLLAMWLVTRRRRQPPTQLRPLTPVNIPPAVAPGVPRGIPPGPAEWDEDGLPRR